MSPRWVRRAAADRPLGDRRASVAALVVAEVALSVILLLGTGVLVRNFVSLLNVDLGFDTSHTMLVRVAFAPGSYETVESRLRVYREVLDRVGRLPGVTSVALSNGMSAFGGFDAAIAANGRPADERPVAFVKAVSEGYRATIGLRLLAGRESHARRSRVVGAGRARQSDVRASLLRPRQPARPRDHHHHARRR